MCYKNNYAEAGGIHLPLLQGPILHRKVSYIFFFFHILKLLGVSYCNDKPRHEDTRDVLWPVQITKAIGISRNVK